MKEFVPESTPVGEAAEVTELILSEDEFKSFQDKGYFDNIKYTWSMVDDIYSVYISNESYQQFLINAAIFGE